MCWNCWFLRILLSVRFWLAKDQRSRKLRQEWKVAICALQRRVAMGCSCLAQDWGEVNCRGQAFRCATETRAEIFHRTYGVWWCWMCTLWLKFWKKHHPCCCLAKEGQANKSRRRSSVEQSFKGFGDVVFAAQLARNWSDLELVVAGLDGFVAPVRLKSLTQWNCMKLCYGAREKSTGKTWPHHASPFFILTTLIFAHLNIS